MRKRFLIKMIPFYLLVMACLVTFTHIGDQAVSAFRLDNYVYSGKCVVVDAGHGGVDGGATSCTGVLESGINLEISQRLNDLLNLLGIKTVMIRNDDRSVYTYGDTIAQKKISDLKERVRIINETEDPILVSIHQNYFTNSKYSGTQVFCRNDEDSKHLATLLQGACKVNLETSNNRTIKNAKGVYLMENITCPGVLIECGFLSNPKEEALLRDAEYQKEMCVVFAVTICNYLDQQAMG